VFYSLFIISPTFSPCLLSLGTWQCFKNIPPSFLLIFCSCASCLVILFLISTAALSSGFCASTLWLATTAALNPSAPHLSFTSSVLGLGVCAPGGRPAEAADLQGSPSFIISLLCICSLQLCFLQLEGESASIPAKKAGNLAVANRQRKRGKRDWPTMSRSDTFFNFWVF